METRLKVHTNKNGTRDIIACSVVGEKVVKETIVTKAVLLGVSALVDGDGALKIEDENTIITIEVHLEPKI